MLHGNSIFTSTTRSLAKLVSLTNLSNQEDDFVIGGRFIRVQVGESKSNKKAYMTKKAVGG